ncbi:MAG: EamA family transporter [Desulfovermiculus sp.]|nr:EamA family transporter [Desulfovermiculus sp.]
MLGAILSGGVLGPLALLFGLRLAQASSVSLWLDLELAVTAVLGVVLFRDHLTRVGWAGVASALLGSLVLAWDRLPLVLFLPHWFCWPAFVGALSDGTSIMLYIRSAQMIGATRAQVVFSAAPFLGVVLQRTILTPTGRIFTIAMITNPKADNRITSR